jgi:hypothetical protein
VVQGDYDGDKDEESVVDELTGLVDERVAFLTDADGLVLQINDLDYVADELPLPRDGRPTGSKPATSAPTEAATTGP